MRAVILQIELDDNKAISAGLGTIDYLERELAQLAESGVCLKNARILDADDKRDTNAIQLIKEIF